MTRDEARLFLASPAAIPQDPRTWEAYQVWYERLHPLDPKYVKTDEEVDKARRSQKYDVAAELAAWPVPEFEAPEGFNPAFFATESTTRYLASLLEAEAVYFPPYTTGGPFLMPGAWWLKVGGEYMSAGVVAGHYQEGLRDFEDAMVAWNLNAGALNQAHEPISPGRALRRKLGVIL
jgi:hypothetical protein